MVGAMGSCETRVSADISPLLTSFIIVTTLVIHITTVMYFLYFIIIGIILLLDIIRTCNSICGHLKKARSKVPLFEAASFVVFGLSCQPELCVNDTHSLIPEVVGG